MSFLTSDKKRMILFCLKISIRGKLNVKKTTFLVKQTDFLWKKLVGFLWVFCCRCLGWGFCVCVFGLVFWGGCCC